MKFAHLFFIISVMSLTVCMGCDRTRDMVADMTTDTVTGTDMEMGTPVIIVSLISLPEGGGEAYANWVDTITETLVSPEELVKVKAYRNVMPNEHPQLYSEFMFNSFLDAARYLNRPEIAAILQDQSNYMSEVSVHTFIERSDYDKNLIGDWEIKMLTLIDFPIGGKQAYLDWAASHAPALIEQPEVKSIATYDNYYGISPQRLIAVEFANAADADAWYALDLRKAYDAELQNYADSKAVHVFELIPPDIEE